MFVADNNDGRGWQAIGVGSESEASVQDTGSYGPRALAASRLLTASLAADVILDIHCPVTAYVDVARHHAPVRRPQGSSTQVPGGPWNASSSCAGVLPPNDCIAASRSVCRFCAQCRRDATDLWLLWGLIVVCSSFRNKTRVMPTTVNEAAGEPLSAHPSSSRAHRYGPLLVKPDVNSQPSSM